MHVLGNRGKCAQPCRLPYELICSSEKNYKTIDKGHLLSTRDLCSLELLPSLVNLGIKCFKIEGRLKSPEYVSTVTRIYRKYIDLALSDKPYIIDELDKTDLSQVFNRGGFSTGYLHSQPNNNLIFKQKPNNMGIFLGKVLHFNKNKGYITLQLENDIQIGDKVSVEKENGTYNVSEIMLNNFSNLSNNAKILYNKNSSSTLTSKFSQSSNQKGFNKHENNDTNIPFAYKNQIVKIGRMKGNINVGDNVYKMSSQSLNTSVKNLINTENIKTDIDCKLKIHKNTPISMNISTKSTIQSSQSLYYNINFTITSDLISIDAINSPITKEKVIEHINKISETPFRFREIFVDLDDNMYIPSISKLNQLRRDCVKKLEEIIVDRIHRDCNFDSSLLENDGNMNNNFFTNIFNKHTNNGLHECTSSDTIINTYNIFNNNDYISNNFNNSVTSSTLKNTKAISILLNSINVDFDYKNLKNISKIYIPLRYFNCNTTYYTATLTNICNNYDTYIYMPSVLKNLKIVNFENILDTYNIKGFVLSNLSHFYFLNNNLEKLGNKNFSKTYEFIANYNLNIFNNFTISELEKLNVTSVTISPELDKQNINEICSLLHLNLSNNEILNHKKLTSEVIVYGNLPVMTTNYCLISKGNFCLKSCDTNCSSSNKKYYLKDRMNMNFRVMPDSFSGITTIFNSKKLSISCNDLLCNFIRLDFIDESIDEINRVVKLAIDGNIVQGKDFTNGNFNRIV